MKQFGMKQVGAWLCGIVLLGGLALPGYAAQEDLTQQFSDEIFRTYVRSVFDRNGDGKVTEEELAGVTVLELSGLELRSLDGIALFADLRELYCDGNLLTQLDLSQNRALVILDCGDNQLTRLDLSENRKLEALYCYYNQITELDVSQNNALIKLDCAYNRLTGLDVTGLNDLEGLFCDHNRMASNGAVLGWEEATPAMTYYPQSVHQEAFQNYYTDLEESNWFYNAVSYLAMEGVYGAKIFETAFLPDELADRGEFVTTLHRAVGSPNLESSAVFFVDLERSAPYYDAVIWSAQNEIVLGVGADRFAPEDAISRQDVAVVFLRYADYAGVTLEPVKEAPSFADEAQIAGYARSAVSTLCRAGILEGYENGRFAPEGTVTRAELAAMLCRFLQYEEAAQP